MPAGPATSGPLSFVTLQQFLDQLPPVLTMLHDGGSGGQLLRWVEPSELEDPTPYLPEGEFLLTAGLPFLGDGGSPPRGGADVRRVGGAQGAALGFWGRAHFGAGPGGFT